MSTYLENGSGRAGFYGINEGGGGMSLGLRCRYTHSVCVCAEITNELQ